MIYTTTANCSTQNVSLKSIQSAMDEFTRECKGHLTATRIEFRTAAEIEPWFRRAGVRIEREGLPTDFLMGIPIKVNPELQGPSPKIIKRLA